MIDASNKKDLPRVSITFKYVNMADVLNYPLDGNTADRTIYDHESLVACVELLFFAYRDFTSDPDVVLEELGFGRAHHRVLHFVHRNPGLRVARLLDILKITKQSLARVLKQLIDTGFIVQKTGPHDRRERRLFATERGSALANKLIDLQVKRIAAALAEAGPGADEATRKFLLAMISKQQRREVKALTKWAEPECNEE